MVQRRHPRPADKAKVARTARWGNAGYGRPYVPFSFLTEDYPTAPSDAYQGGGPAVFYLRSEYISTFQQLPYVNLTEVTGTGTHTLQVQVPSTYWVDMVGFAAGNYNNHPELISYGTPDNKVTNIRIPGGRFATGHRTWDVYGYGVEFTVGFRVEASNYTNYVGLAAMLIPNTFITESGQIVLPPALEGYQVARDF